MKWRKKNKMATKHSKTKVLELEYTKWTKAKSALLRQSLGDVISYNKKLTVFSRYSLFSSGIYYELCAVQRWTALIIPQAFVRICLHQDDVSHTKKKPSTQDTQENFTPKISKRVIIFCSIIDRITVPSIRNDTQWSS